MSWFYSILPNVENTFQGWMDSLHQSCKGRTVLIYLKISSQERVLFLKHQFWLVSLSVQWDKYLFISLFRYVVVWVVELSYGSWWADNNMVINLWYSITLLSLNAKKLSAILCLYYDSKVCWSEQPANSDRWQCQRATGLNQVKQIIWRH